MNLLKPWAAHCKALEKARTKIEDISALFPSGGSGRHMRDALTKAWAEVMASTDELDTIITDAVQPLPVDFPWQDKEFSAHWKLYKDYLSEQHGVAMKSRMELARLNAIRKFSGENRDVFVKTIDFYMALGTVSLFQVNFDKNEKSENNAQPQRITLNVPGF